MEDCCNLVPFHPTKGWLNHQTIHFPHFLLLLWTNFLVSLVRFTQRPLETSGTPRVLGYLGRRSCLENTPRLLAKRMDVATFATFKPQDLWHNETPETKFIQTIPNKNSGFPKKSERKMSQKPWWKILKMLLMPMAIPM